MKCNHLKKVYSEPRNKKTIQIIVNWICSDCLSGGFDILTFNDNEYNILLRKKCDLDREVL